MKTTKLVSAAIGAVLVALTTAVAVPASAASPLNYTIDCSYTGVDIYADIPIYAGQDAVFTFSPATCTQAYWSMLNPDLPDNTSLSGTSTATILAADVVCDSEFEIVTPSSDYYYLTFTGCGPEPEPEALPNTGIETTSLGLGAIALVLAGGIALLALRRRAV